VLFAPKSGRELREQMFGGAAAKLLPPVAERYPLPEGGHTEHEDAATLEQPPIATPYVGTAVEPESLVEEPPAAVDETAGEDLLARIAATRIAVEAELAEPFGPGPGVEPVPTEGPPPTVEPALYWELTSEAVAAEEPALEGGELGSLWTDEVDDQTAAMPVEAPHASEAEIIEDTVVIEPTETVPPWETPPPAASEEPVAEPPADAEEPGEAEEPEAEIESAAVIIEERVAPVEEADQVPASVIADDAAVEEAALVREHAPIPSAETLSGGGPVDQAEMRRRIEETRARLKAKAFDAMMSGESALLRNDSGTKTVPSSDSASLAPDIDSTIDESLSPEDP
ncbi:MAG TPA: hypothetical protein VFH61_15620, partial [Thermoleophilia bacterium]|nr:hypothetical protein [Thermoleophilia bacterium]